MPLTSLQHIEGASSFAAPKIAKYSTWLARAMHAQGRDESHGMAHFERVRVAALDLARRGNFDLSEHELLLLQLAALSHDVLDHKYFAPTALGQHEKAEMRLAMVASLRGLPLGPEVVEDVCLISDNISLSKELEGRLQHAELADRGLSLLRDLVSDADKLDALGVGGLLRLAQFQAAHLNKEGKCVSTFLTASLLKEKASELLLHRQHYLRTGAAQHRGQQLLRETVCILASEAALAQLRQWTLISCELERIMQ